MNLLELPFFEYVLMLVVLLLSAYISFFLQLLFHEGGHLIGGLLTGYRFSSFRIGCFILIKQNGKLRLKLYDLAGTGGQCLLLPPPMKDGRIPYVLYNLGGTLANLIFAAFCLPWAFICEAGIFHSFMVQMSIIGIGFAIVNGIPMHGNSLPNDGNNTKSLSKNKNALYAFWLQMQISGEQSEGVRLKDMPDEWFEMPSKDDMKNSMCSAIAVMRANRLLDMQDFTAASSSIDELLADSKSGETEIHGIYLQLMTCDRIFCELITDGRREVIAELLTKRMRGAMEQMETMPCIIRTEYALALLYDNDPEAAARLEARFNKHVAKHPYMAEVECEREFIKLIKQKAEELRPQV